MGMFDPRHTGGMFSSPAQASMGAGAPIFSDPNYLARILRNASPQQLAALIQRAPPEIKQAAQTELATRQQGSLRPEDMVQPPPGGQMMPPTQGPPPPPMQGPPPPSMQGPPPMPPGPMQGLPPMQGPPPMGAPMQGPPQMGGMQGPPRIGANPQGGASLSLPTGPATPMDAGYSAPTDWAYPALPPGSPVMGPGSTAAPPSSGMGIADMALGMRKPLPPGRGQPATPQLSQSDILNWQEVMAHGGTVPPEIRALLGA